MQEITIRLRKRTIERIVFTFIIVILLIFGIFYYLRANKLEKEAVSAEEEQQPIEEEQSFPEEQQPIEEEQQPKEPIEKETPSQTREETGVFEYEGTSIDARIDNVTYRKTSSTTAKLTGIRLTLMNGKDTPQYLFADMYVYDTAKSTEQEIDYNELFANKVRERINFPKMEPKTQLVKDYVFSYSLYHLNSDQIIKLVIRGEDEKAIKTIYETFRVV